MLLAEDFLVKQNMMTIVSEQLRVVYESIVQRLGIQNKFLKSILAMIYGIGLSYVTFSIPNTLSNIFSNLTCSMILNRSISLKNIIQHTLATFMIRHYAKRDISYIIINKNHTIVHEHEGYANRVLFRAIIYTLEKDLENSMYSHLVLTHANNFSNSLSQENIDFESYPAYNNLKNYRMMNQAPLNQYITCTNGIIFHKELKEIRGESTHYDLNKHETEKKPEIFKSTLIITLYGKTAKFLNEFVNGALEKYSTEVLKRSYDWFTKDTKVNLYLYNLQKRVFSVNKQDNDSSNKNDKDDKDIFKRPDRGTACFERILLKINKGFDSIFFPQKELILQVIDDFMKKEGKYKIAGYPQKLGFMLHGPPGSGKTSFIRALAKEMKRNIVHVSLKCIRTNEEFYQILIKNEILVAESSTDKCGRTHYLTAESNIYVFEDIDCMGNLVKSRKIKAKENNETENDFPNKISVTELVNLHHSMVIKQKKISEDIKSAVGPSGTIVSPAITADTTTIMKQFIKKYEEFRNQEMQDDELDFGSMLNILDGIVETPGRVIIMTTNHLELLDPALIRPGRIDKILHFGYIKPRECFQMIEHYFPERKLYDHEKKLIAEILSDALISPAEVEQRCCEYDSIEDIVKSFEKHRDPTTGII